MCLFSWPPPKYPRAWPCNIFCAFCVIVIRHAIVSFLFLLHLSVATMSDRESIISASSLYDVSIVFSVAHARARYTSRDCQCLVTRRFRISIVPTRRGSPARMHRYLVDFYDDTAGFFSPVRRFYPTAPRILDSAVLISELWARRGNSHSKNGFFRPSGAVMER